MKIRRLELSSLLGWQFNCHTNKENCHTNVKPLKSTP